MERIAEFSSEAGDIGAVLFDNDIIVISQEATPPRKRAVRIALNLDETYQVVLLLTTLLREAQAQREMQDALAAYEASA